MNTDEFRRRDLSRRQFLGRSAQNAAGVAAGMVGLSSSVARADRSEPVRVGVIGVRTQGKTLAAQFAAQPQVTVAAVCDVDESLKSAVIKPVMEHQTDEPRWESDFRRLLDDPQIDAVAIATPDHWHAIMGVMACQAGKDVYLEKPVSLTIEEGRRLVEVARANDCVMQVGLQQRSGTHFQSAVELVRSGKLGTVRFAKAWLANARRPLPRRSDEAVPAGVDYDLWLGPSAERNFNTNRFHYHWHWFRDYGTGELGNWGVHLLDVARWGMELDLPERVSASGGNYVFGGEAEFPDTLAATFHYPQHTITWEHRLWSDHGLEGRSSGVAFHGERGTLVVDRSGWKVYDSKERLTSDASELLGSHVRNFIDCVRTRQKPNADIEIGHASTTLCHLGNIAWQLGREVRFDGRSETFPGDVEADAMLTRAYRDPWTLPAV
jgi:predicted dehydrogenase